jgi:predicted hydrocarbon binding protein
MSTTNIGQGGYEVFETGHSVFDEIMKLRPGMSVLLVDETFSEGWHFLRALLQGIREDTVELFSSRYQTTAQGMTTVTIDSLQDLSIQVNQQRRQKKRRIFIHGYLPELLVKHNTEEVLKLMEIWQREVSSSGNIEFYLLPRNTFEGFEKKARSIVDAVLDLSAVRAEGKFRFYVTPVRTNDIRYHLKNIQYEIRDGRLYLEWNGVLLDKLPKTFLNIDEVKKRITAMEDRFVVRLSEINPERITLSDYVLLSSINNRRVSEIRQLYPDIWDTLNDKIAEWVVTGVVKLEEVEPGPFYPRRTKLKLKNRLLLAVPTGIALKLVSLSKGFLGKRVRTVPLDAHIAVLDAVKRVIDYAASKSSRLRDDVRLATYYFGELSARETALEYVKRLEGTPYTTFRLSDAPKLIAITLKAGWGINIVFTHSSSEGWVFEVEDCHLCKEVKSEEPFCDKFISSVVIGVLGVCLKRRAICSEISCRAMGADKCIFKCSMVR